jgi:hypothetical protein
MFEMLQGRLMPILSADYARRMGRAGLRQPCLVILTGLAVQLALGMVLNLYIAIPVADARASYLREIETAPGVLTAHALIALLLLATAGLMLLRAVALRDLAVIALAATGLATLLGAFAAGELFVKDNTNSASLTMALLTGTALLCYACLQALIIRQRPRGRAGLPVRDAPVIRRALARTAPPGRRARPPGPGRAGRASAGCA